MAYATSPRRSAGRMPVAPARKTGTWKVAYADFLTALVAFFLVLWLVGGNSPAERAELASYFSDKDIAQTVDAPLLVVPTAPPVLDALKQHAALQAAPESVKITEEPDFIRVDLVDSANRPLFDTGNGKMTHSGKQLASSVGDALAPFVHGISIEGHTDAFAGSTDAFSNWDLSSERANDARRLLSEAGIAPDRIQAVTGLADTRPLKPGQPHLSANRRVSILVHIGD